MGAAGKSKSGEDKQAGIDAGSRTEENHGSDENWESDDGEEKSQGNEGWERLVADDDEDLVAEGWESTDDSEGDEV
jgi:hypothetical protein